MKNRPRDEIAIDTSIDEDEKFADVKDIDIEKRLPVVASEQQVSEPPHSVFTKGMKIWIVFLVSISALISPFGATTFLPALNILSDVLAITPAQVNISVTTYMIAQAIAPAFIGTMSDNSGRRLSFIVCFVIFTIGNIGLALQTNYVALLLLRMVQAVGGTATISLSFAVVADIATSAERGKYMGYAGAGILMGPAFGPTVGGLLSQYLGWRSIFWFLAIFSGVLLLLFIFFFPETCRAIVGNGSIPPSGVSRSVISCIQERKPARQSLKEGATRQIIERPKRKSAYPNPVAVLRIIAEMESGMILLYNGLFFTGMMVTVTVIPVLFHEIYGLNELHVGLCYISNGVAALISSLSMGHVVDWNFRRHAKALGVTIEKGKQPELGNFPIERVRLEIVVPAHIVGIIGLLIFGWTLKFKTHIAGPEIALFIIGFSFTIVFNSTNGLLIDLNRDRPATATAAVNFVRCLMSAGGSAAIVPLCHKLNPGWTYTLLALIYVVLIGMVFWIMRDGMKWRQKLDEKKRMAVNQANNVV